METLYYFESVISDVVQAEVRDDENQKFACKLLGNGTLQLKFWDLQGHLRSRICLPLRDAQAVETLRIDANKDVFTLRYNGAQIPLVLPVVEMEKLMDCVDALDHKKESSVVNNISIPK